MSTSAYQLQFAAELVAMLVAVAGLILVVLRTDLAGRASWARAALAVGFVAVGVAAFIHGSLLSSNVSQHAQRVLSIVRLAGDGSIALGCARWNASRRVRAVLWLGVAVSAAAGVSELTEASSSLTDLLLIVGSVGVAVALVAGSRRSIVARVAAGAAATLLLMVLVLSVALSSVIANSAQRDALNNLASRARVEGGAALADGTASVKDARFVAADLQGYFRTNSAPLIGLQGVVPAVPAAPIAADEAAVSMRLGLLSSLYPSVGLAYVAGSGRVLTAPPPVGDATLLSVIARQPLVADLSCTDTSGRSSAIVAGTSLVVAAAYPLCLTPAGGSAAGPGDTRLGVAVVVSPLDHAYLLGRHNIDPSTSLAFVAPGGVLATAGAQPPASLLATVARQALAAGRSSTSSRAQQELAVEPLTDADGTPVAVLVASTTDASVLRAQARLERTLFLIALGGTVIGLLFVAAIGERITAGLRRLTDVAERVRRGGTGERANIVANDEVGALGAAFDSMVDSIERQTADLQEAADDETRLRNRLQAVVAGMGDALVATDAYGDVIEFNAAAEHLTGVAAGAAFGTAVREVVDLVGDDGTRLGPRLQRPAGTWTQLAQLRREDATEVPVAVSAGVLRGPAGEAAGGVLVIRDLRRELELERMKSEFLSRVGHELRTPLTAIMGYAEILMSRRVSASQSLSWHHEILASAKRLARIVELLEFFASTGAGRVLLNPQPVEVDLLLSDVVAEWEDRMGERHSLVKQVDHVTPMIHADRRWLVLALNELMDNAVKFSPGGGRISLAAESAPEGGGVDITVADRGMGMTEQEQAVAFGEFVQGDASDTRRFGGLGLGLALVQRVVQGHGGSVLCDSSPGGGSRLTVRLPAVAPPSGENGPGDPERPRVRGAG